VLRLLGRVAYWVAVVAVSVLLLVVLVKFFESRDDSGVEGGGVPERRGVQSVWLAEVATSLRSTRSPSLLPESRLRRTALPAPRRFQA
jgi:hypothetical protein